ncbi:tyrosine-type recombinase/integrase [Bradyrhizobium sp. SZCCHNRI2007]|uniref:tyrosine-type recombinase/integrase n=1 Tax=Bradyrhizobium sp. SZCCHNRI2007 TaxID=3057281 RepID=UPI0028EAD1C7|nr:tyrosine-type recombinase/integrase [Bradyrhizobium sp. SZCCHNRI2007]
MAKHLWRRGNSGWTFQIAIPKAFIKSYGATPFRISLGALSVAEARRRARILAGVATARMGADMSRETVNRGLAEVAAQLEHFAKKETTANFTVLRAGGALDDIDNGDEGLLPESMTVVHEQRLAAARAERAIFRDMRNRLDKIGREIVHDGNDWETERQIYDRTVDRLSQQKPITVNLPILSVAAEEVIVEKEKALTDKSASYIGRLRRAVKAFIGIIGDKKVSEYKPTDVQKYATTLGLLPKTWSTDKRLRDLQPLDIIKRAERIRGLKPISRTTVAEYVAEFRNVWKVIRATHPHDVLSLAHEDLWITLPRSASRPTEREGLSIESLNKFLDVSSRRKRADDRFLPLLGVLTGARLGELVYLQVSDLQKRGNHWTLSLVDDIEDEDGEVVARQLKTDQSRRTIALPDVIFQTGFVDWVQGLKAGTLWPQLFRTERPHATASKRMARLMKSAGVHVELIQTYHSLRHGYKDYLRSMKIDIRTIDLQVGHALDSVSKAYGSKSLRPDEIVTIATLPLPEGLDLSVYRRRPR